MTRFDGPKLGLDCSHLAPQSQQYYISNFQAASISIPSLFISSPGQQDVAIELAKPFTQPWDKEGSEEKDTNLTQGKSTLSDN